MCWIQCWPDCIHSLVSCIQTPLHGAQAHTNSIQYMQRFNYRSSLRFHIASGLLYSRLSLDQGRIYTTFSSIVFSEFDCNNSSISPKLHSISVVGLHSTQINCMQSIVSLLSGIEELLWHQSSLQFRTKNQSNVLHTISIKLLPISVVLHSDCLP